MSQINFPSGGGGGGGPINEIAVDVNGPSIPSAGIINLLGQSSSDNVTAGIRTVNDPDASNNVFIQLTNRITGNGQSLNGGTVDLVTFALGASPASYRFSFLIAGRTATEGLGYTIDCSIFTDGAAASIISLPDQDADEDPGLADALMDIIASGNNLIVRATGVVGENIDYKLVGNYVVV